MSVEQIVEALMTNNLESAQELIEAELNKRSENIKATITESILKSICEGQTSVNTSIGVIKYEPKSGYGYRLYYPVKAGEDILKAAAKFAKFVDASKSKYKAVGKDKTVTIYIDGVASYDLQLDGNVLVMDGDMIPSGDIEYFKKHKKFLDLDIG
jgi:hypothetical protein